MQEISLALARMLLLAESSWRSRLRGATRHRWRQREESTSVRASSLVGRRETMSPSMPSGRLLIQSVRRSSRSSLLFLALVSIPMSMADGGAAADRGVEVVPHTATAMRDHE
jgi:hypothetical protein